MVWKIGGDNPYYFHLLAVLAHIGCVVLLFFLCQYLFHVTAFSFLAALIFAVHPIHTEAVSWISADSYVFSSFFFLLSFILYARSRRSLVYLMLAVVSSGLCLAVGNTVVSLPFLLLCFEIIFPDGRDKNRLLRILTLLLLTVIAILFAGIFFFMRNTFTRLIFLHRGPQYLIVVTKAFVYYLKILYLPLARGLYHPFAFNTAHIQNVSPVFFSGLAIFLGSCFAAFTLRKRHKEISFAILWFLITYAPYSNIIPICNIISERYLYLPSVGFSILLAALFLKAWGVIQKTARLKVFLRFCAVAAMTFFISSYAYLTVKRNYEYHNILTYWESNIRNFPDGYIVYNNLAATFYAMGNRQTAKTYCFVNLMVNAQQPHVWCNLAKIFREEGNIDDARSCYERALQIDEKYPPALEGMRAIEKQANKKN
jgi:hypothetical protein